MIEKRPQLKSEKHRRFVANHRCVVCNLGYLGRDPDPMLAISQAAHVNYLGRKHDGMRGKGQKARDLWCVPMCSWHHEEQGAYGQSGIKEAAFWRSYFVAPEPICRQLAEQSPDPKVREAIAQLKGAV